MEVHGELGPGFLELVYRTALIRELTAQAIPFHHEKEIAVSYKGLILPVAFRVDFLCYGTTIVELKAKPDIGGAEEAQTLNYLRASGLSKALLINFGESSLSYRRFVRSRNWK